MFLAFQTIGLVAAICEAGGIWDVQYRKVRSCTSKYGFVTAPTEQQLPVVARLISYCKEPQKRDVSTTAVGEHTNSFPSVVARQVLSTSASATPSGSAVIVVSTTNLVPCPARTINPTYTPATALPTSYIWGCPPGLVCAPPQIGCDWNFSPAGSYVCRPEHCIRQEGAPPFLSDDWIQQWYGSQNGTLPPFPPSGNWTNLDPQFWGLDVAQFLTTVNITVNNDTSTISSSSLLTSASSSPTDSPRASESSSSKAWIAGAVIGPIAVLGLLLLGFILLRRRKRQAERRLQEEAKIESSREKPQLAGTEILRKELTGEDIKELDTVTQRKELEGKVAAHELGPHHEPAELDGTTMQSSSAGTEPTSTSDRSRIGDL